MEETNRRLLEMRDNLSMDGMHNDFGTMRTAMNMYDCLVTLVAMPFMNPSAAEIAAVFIEKWALNRDNLDGTEGAARAEEFIASTIAFLKSEAEDSRENYSSMDMD